MVIYIYIYIYIYITTTRIFTILSKTQVGTFFENSVKNSILRWSCKFMFQIRFWMTIRSTMRIIFQIILPPVLLAVGVVLANNSSSKTSTSDGKFLYKPSIYLQQGADPTSTLFPVLYKVVSNAGKYFTEKLYFEFQDF